MLVEVETHLEKQEDGLVCLKRKSKKLKEYDLYFAGFFIFEETEAFLMEEASFGLWCCELIIIYLKFCNLMFLKLALFVTLLSSIFCQEASEPWIAETTEVSTVITEIFPAVEEPESIEIGEGPLVILTGFEELIIQGYEYVDIESGESIEFLEETEILNEDENLNDVHCITVEYCPVLVQPGVEATSQCINEIICA